MQEDILFFLCGWLYEIWLQTDRRHIAEGSPRDRGVITVYCGTHTPQGYENLKAKRVIDLDRPVPTTLAEVSFEKREASGKYVCSICGYVYDPAEHDGVAFEDLPDDWRCPLCKQPKEKFNKA